MHILQVLSLFGINKIREPRGYVLVLMDPFSKNPCNCFFTSYDYNMHYLYNPIFSKEELNNNYIPCSTSILGGIHLDLGTICMLVIDSLTCTPIFFYILAKDSFAMETLVSFWL